MFQDNPGEGQQPEIFERFYWWEEECVKQVEAAFGIEIVYRSWKELNRQAADISDLEASALLKERVVPREGVSDEAMIRAVKLYIAAKKVVDELGDIVGIGGNCLNESTLSATTPCLAWNWLFEYDHIIWACEGDIVTLVSEYMLYSSLKVPFMMTNIYPFLVGMAALKHEKIQKFPDIADPDIHALGVHCGYFGLAPQSFCSRWMVRPKVLEIVNEKAIMVDCEFPIGAITLAKFRPDMKHMVVIEAELEQFVQYPGSDCRNGALISYRNKTGHQIVESLSSHHAIILQGDVTHLLRQIAAIFGYEMIVL